MLDRSPRAHPLASLLALLGALALPTLGFAAAAGAADLHAWEAGAAPAALAAWVHAHLTRADADLKRLTAASGARTVDNTLRPYDEALNEIYLAAMQSNALYGVGSTKELRDQAQSLTQTANAALTALNLNQQVYNALAAVPVPADAATRHYLERTLLEYRLAGVDRDDATRAKIAALQDKITELGLAFERAVHDDVRTVIADKSQLEGLPADYLTRHPADAEGHVNITSDFPDTWPAQDFSTSSELRHKLYLAQMQVGYPANTETLRQLLEQRLELAHLLGYASWADFAMADQMIGSPAKLADYLKNIDEAARLPGGREDAGATSSVSTTANSWTAITSGRASRT